MNRERADSRLQGWMPLGVALLAWSLSAQAQRADENAVAQATDAFGSTVGREEVGLYSAGRARGFNPSQAGNLRIDGIYFDQISQADLVGRVVRGSTVHVGISAQGFAFPAPTGVVDFHLRTPGKETAGGVLLGVSSYNQWYGEFDFQAPLIDNVLSIGAGYGYSDDNSYKIADDSNEWNAGVIARWQPTAALTITPFWSTTSHKEYQEKPYVFIGAAGAPREYRADELMSQPWTRYGFETDNFGATARLALADNWQVDAGVFHSESRTGLNYEPFLFDVDANGEGNYAISASQPLTSRSVSGEVRVSKKINTPNVRNTFYASVRARHRSNEFGGSDTIEVGRGSTRAVPQIAPLAFTLGPVGHVDAEQVTPGLAYDGVWRNVGQLSLGVQKPFYDRTTYTPNSAPISGSSEPWLHNIGAAAYLSKAWALYASYTRGFEEIGSAPLNSVNRDEVVPAQLTEQTDAGIRYHIRDDLTLVAGVFEIKKPFFDTDQNRIYRSVGTISNRGVEVSLTGSLTQQLTVVAGFTLIDPEVKSTIAGNSRTTEAVGPVPRLLRTNFQYRVASVPGLMLDARVERASSRWALYGVTRLPAVTTMDAGLRYQTQVLGRNATVRLKGYNLTDEFSLAPSSSGQLQPNDGRSFDLSLALDF